MTIRTLLRALLSLGAFPLGIALMEFFRDTHATAAQTWCVTLLVGTALWLGATKLDFAWRWALVGPIFLFGVGLIPTPGSVVSISIAGTLLLLGGIWTLMGLNHSRYAVPV